MRLGRVAFRARDQGAVVRVTKFGGIVWLGKLLWGTSWQVVVWTLVDWHQQTDTTKYTCSTSGRDHVSTIHHEIYAGSRHKWAKCIRGQVLINNELPLVSAVWGRIGLEKIKLFIWIHPLLRWVNMGQSIYRRLGKNLFFCKIKKSKISICIYTYVIYSNF